MSLDTRGIRPTLAQIAAVQSDPANLEIYAEAYTQDVRFASQMAWLWNDTLHTGVFGESFYRFDGWPDSDWRVVGLEPLKIIERVIEEERPFTDMVTVEQTQMDGELADIWGMDIDLAPGQWGGCRMWMVDRWRVCWLQHPVASICRGCGQLQSNPREHGCTRVFLCSDFLDRERHRSKLMISKRNR